MLTLCNLINCRWWHADISVQMKEMLFSLNALNHRHTQRHVWNVFILFIFRVFSLRFNSKRTKIHTNWWWRVKGLSRFFVMNTTIYTNMSLIFYHPFGMSGVVVIRCLTLVLDNDQQTCFISLSFSTNIKLYLIGLFVLCAHNIFFLFFFLL